MESSEKLLFAVLVPHRDFIPALETCRRALFAAGLNGAFAFPAAAPLALLKRPLDPAELKNASAELRKSLEDNKIVCSGYSECSAWNTAIHTIRFFGITLDMPLPVFPPDAVLQQWEKPILAPAILLPDDTITKVTIDPLAMPRAAALANLALQPLPNTSYSFTWEMDPLFWLPSIRKKRQINGNVVSY